MKEIIESFYNIYIDSYKEINNNIFIKYDGYYYFFCFFNRGYKELKELINITNELKHKGLHTNSFILNKYKNYITYVNDLPYIMVKITDNYNEEYDLIKMIYEKDNYIINNNSNINRSNWEELWSRKVDYFEYQIKELGKDKTIIIDSFSYYIGLCENAISYVNNANKLFKYESCKLYLSHKRLKYPNYSIDYNNPLNYIIDLEVRDIAEYIKDEFFCGSDAFLDLKTYLKIRKLSSYEYYMLFARLLYPSYYFDRYEQIMNNNESEESLLSIIDKVNLYEEFLNKAYYEIKKYSNIEEINWIIKES